MSDTPEYIPPKIETLEASQVVAQLGPVSAGSQKGSAWGTGRATSPLG